MWPQNLLLIGGQSKVIIVPYGRTGMGLTYLLDFALQQNEGSGKLQTKTKTTEANKDSS